MTLSTSVVAGDVTVSTRNLARVVDPLGQGGVEDRVDQGRLAGAGDAGDGERGSPSGKLDRHVLQVVLLGVVHDELATRGGRSAYGREAGSPARPDRYLPVSESGWSKQILDRAGHDDLAAVLTGTRADVDGPVGVPDRVLVVLDHDQRVAEVAEPDQGLDQPVVVALVQPDRRLVEHVQDADQAGPDLGGQPDALRLAAGQRARSAG